MILLLLHHSPCRDLLPATDRQSLANPSRPSRPARTLFAVKCWFLQRAELLRKLKHSQSRCGPQMLPLCWWGRLWANAEVTAGFRKY